MNGVQTERAELLKLVIEDIDSEEEYDPQYQAYIYMASRGRAKETL